VNFFINKILSTQKQVFIFSKTSFYFFEFFAEKSMHIKPTKFLDVAGI